MKAVKIAAAVALAGLVTPAYAESTWDSWYNISIQDAYTWSAENDIILGYGSDAHDRNQVRFEFENLWKYGESYVFVDAVSASSDLGGERTSIFGPVFGDGKNTELYGVANVNLSAQKVFGMQRGLFDVALEGRAEFGTFFNYKAGAIGASVYLNLPGFVTNPGDKIQFTWWHRWNDDDFAGSNCFFGSPCKPPFTETRYADHELLGLTIRKEWDMFNLHWQHQTFLRYQLHEKGNAREVERFNRVFWESEIFAYIPQIKGLSVGFRSEYFWDAGGIDKDATTFSPIRNSDWRPLIAVKYDFATSD